MEGEEAGAGEPAWPGRRKVWTAAGRMVSELTGVHSGFGQTDAHHDSRTLASLTARGRCWVKLEYASDGHRLLVPELLSQPLKGAPTSRGPGMALTRKDRGADQVRDWYTTRC